MTIIRSSIKITFMDLKKPQENEQCQLCGRWNNRPVGVDIIVARKGKVLLIKRSTDPDKGMYAVPGGYLDRGESVEDAAKREVKEETGLDVEIVKFVGIRSHPNRYRQIVEIAYIAKVFSGNEKTGDGVDSILWVDPTNLPKEMAILGEHREVVEGAIPYLKSLDY